MSGTRGRALRRSDDVQLDVLCVGPACIDMLTFERDRSVASHPGGNALITSSILARLGKASAILGCIGPDEYGHRIRESLEADGVWTNWLTTCDGCSTRVNHHTVHEDGSWSRTSTSERRCPYLAGRLSLQGIGRLRHCHVGAANVLADKVQAELNDTLGRCRALGASVSAGLAGSVGRTAVQRLFGHSDVVFCNEAELMAWTDVPPGTPVFDALTRTGFSRVVVTQGAAGASTRWEDHFYECRLGQSATSPANTVGAGDVFAAVFIGALQEAHSVNTCLEAATRAGSLSVFSRSWGSWLAPKTPIAALI